MLEKKFSGAQIRQAFIDFFVDRGHTFVPSSSLVPGGDQTLLFTNAGMVQFKDVFLGLDERAYKRAVNSQKCMRVAGKHNDLDDVGRDDTHHTFFEMLGNWSFGDYYKKEAIEWAWDLLTDVWGLPKESLWATCFEDEKGEIERDDEAAEYWIRQAGFDPSHILFFGRKDNFWEMADTGPSGPNSEIHLDLGHGHCALEGTPGHTCAVNLQGCTRFLELWNLVFMQYNRTGPSTLEPLPAKHVDTGAGLERIALVLQGVDSNYKTDFLKPTMDSIQRMTGHSDEERASFLTPYRVITDHSRAAAFLIADGVVPGNTGRNYVSRMIIRRAARFGSLMGLDEPFLAIITESIIENYGEFYRELVRNKAAILDNLTREEIRFHRTLEAGVSKLETILEQTQASDQRSVPGERAFDLYATYGLPLEITRDIAREKGIEVDEERFQEAMEQHRLASGAGEVFGVFGDENIDFYKELLARLVKEGKLPAQGVAYDPYGNYEAQGTMLAIVKDGELVQSARPGDLVEVLLPGTSFYIEAGGQVSDTGTISSLSGPGWTIAIREMRQPISGLIMHIGEVLSGNPKTGDLVTAQVDIQRRLSIMRNHTATHLLHAELHRVLGDHARQAGSLVAPDRLRFDFTHPEALTPEQLDQIEAGVNRDIYANYVLNISHKSLQEAINEGAMALFGEKYAETVRTIAIGGDEPFSYELCGGTHVDETANIGTFLITSESSVGAGLRRIEAVTGQGAYNIIRHRFNLLDQAANLLDTSPDQILEKTNLALDQLDQAQKDLSTFRRQKSSEQFNQLIKDVPLVSGVPVLIANLPGADAETLREMTDRFRQKYPSGVIVLATETAGRPLLIAAVTEDLLPRGLHAGELVKYAAVPLGGSGGGRPTLAQAGGKDPEQLDNALAKAHEWLELRLKN
ncbi:MAG: alanine--tRNA ligase [Chloroflexota bacterium]|nr:MAG: alanine--tRNA ligase [Chloroflexota bacterium]